MMSAEAFTHGLHEIGHGCHAYLQPDGGWGWSNAGLIVDVMLNPAIAEEEEAAG